MELKYHKQGEYLLPNLKPNGEEKKNYGKWGMLRREYLEKYKKGMFNLLEMKGALVAHLNEIDEQAKEMHENIMAKLEKADPPPNKADDPMAWVRHINNHRVIADDFVLNDLIYN